MIMANQSPLDNCNDDVKKLLTSSPDLWDFLSLCFMIDKSKRPNANQLIKHAFLQDVITTEEKIQGLSQMG